MSWEQMLGVLDQVRSDEKLNRDQRDHPVICPEHGWLLEPGANGELHCQFGGHVVRR